MAAWGMVARPRTTEKLSSMAPTQPRGAKLPPLWMVSRAITKGNSSLCLCVTFVIPRGQATGGTSTGDEADRATPRRKSIWRSEEGGGEALALASCPLSLPPLAGQLAGHNQTLQYYPIFHLPSLCPAARFLWPWGVSTSIWSAPSTAMRGWKGRTSPLGLQSTPTPPGNQHTTHYCVLEIIP